MQREQSIGGISHVGRGRGRGNRDLHLSWHEFNKVLET